MPSRAGFALAAVALALAPGCSNGGTPRGDSNGAGGGGESGRGLGGAGGAPTALAPMGDAGSGGAANGGSAGVGGSPSPGSSNSGGTSGSAADAGASGGGATTGGAAGSTPSGGTANAGDAGSNGGAPPTIDPAEDERLIVPEQIAVSNLSGEGQAVNVVALTVSSGPDGPELYAAFQNDGTITGCDAAVSFEFFDGAGQSLGATIGGLNTEQLFRRSDGSGGLVACIEPGRSAMVAVRELPALTIDEVGTVLYQLTYFDRDILPFDLIPVEELVVSDVQAIDGETGSTFAGTLENGLEVTVVAPIVTIFPLTLVGRPLGAATSSSTEDVAAGASWAFETSSVQSAGVDYAAFPGGTVSFDAP